MSCRVANKRGPLIWQRDEGFWLSTERQMVAHTDRYSVQSSSAEPEQLQQQPSELAGPIKSLSNYTLRISNISLTDDGHYFCILAAADDLHRPIKSRSGRLTVLQPPSRLDVIVRQLGHGETANVDFGLETAPLDQSELAAEGLADKVSGQPIGWPNKSVKRPNANPPTPPIWRRPDGTNWPAPPSR